LLSMPGAAPTTARGRTLYGAGCCAFARGEGAAAIAFLEEAVACLRVAEDLPGLSRALAVLGAYLPPSEGDRAQGLAEEALHLARAVGGAYNLAFVEGLVGVALAWHGGTSTVAREHLEEAVRQARSLDAQWLTMFALVLLSILVEAAGQHEQASALWHEALPLAEATGDRAQVATSRLGLARTATTSGDRDAAAAHWRKALELGQELGSAAITAVCLAGMAGLLSTAQRFEPAVRLLAATDLLRHAAEQNPLFGPQFQAAFTPALSPTKAALSAETFAQAWAAGQALTLDQATDLALAELASAPLDKRGN
jgi:tetratricopeptide (TPR) repeat protein